MNQVPPVPRPSRRGWSWSEPTLAATLFVVLLSLAALLVPHSTPRGSGGLFVVVDPLGASRGEEAFGPLTAWLAAGGRRSLRLEVVSDLAVLGPDAWAEVELVFCPDGVALGLSRDRFATLAVGRRHPPHNLRPRSMLVYRRAAGHPAEPWFQAPSRTILGDSLSLAGFGVICRKGIPLRGGGGANRWRGRWTFGPDPFDHTPALHALRLGCFDFAVVREVAVKDFLAAGLLDPQTWGVAQLSGPLPDLVLLVSRKCPAPARVRLGEILMGLGRHPDHRNQQEQAVLAGLARVGLDGFNLLLEPDFEQVRRRYDRCWPEGGY